LAAIMVVVRFSFYEIISEENEFKMLLGDEMIKPYVKDDIKTI
jgi:hypothetical protein